MIARAPHPVFAALWGLLIVLTIVAGVLGPTYRTFATAVLAGVAVLEAAAVVYRGGRRDTLSEITTWVNRHLSKHRVPLRGWNSLVAIQAVALGYLVYVVAIAWGGLQAAPYAVVVASLFAFGQHAHWLSPDVHG